MPERFTVHPDGSRFRVQDNGVLTRGRFHTEAAAWAWIDAELRHWARINSASHRDLYGRAVAHLLPEGIAGDIGGEAYRWRPELAKD